MPRKKKVTTLDIQNVLRNKGWEKDRWGHMQKEMPPLNGKPRRLRIKIQKISVRVESQIIFPPDPPYQPTARKEWHRVGGCYMKEVTIEDDSVKIGKYTF